jgi:hypothetical protein
MGEMENMGTVRVKEISAPPSVSVPATAVAKAPKAPMAPKRSTTTTTANTTYRGSEYYSSRHNNRSSNTSRSDGSCVCAFLLLIMFSAVALSLTGIYFIVNAYDHPLSSISATVRGHHSGFQTGGLILIVIAGVATSCWVLIMIPAIEKSCLSVFGVLCIMSLCTMPFWLGIAAAPRAMQSVWDNGCDSYDLNAVLNASLLVGVDISLGTAAIQLSSGANYTMELFANSPNQFSFTVIDSWQFYPFIEQVLYNNETNTITVNNITGHYNITSQLTFPSLDMTSNAPSFVNFTRPEGPTLAWLTYNGATVLYTVNTNYYNFWQLKVCGSLDPPGDFQIALGVVFIQHYLDSLYINQNSQGRPVFLWNIPK